MNIKIIGILICLLLCTSVSAVAGIKNDELDANPEEKIKINSQPTLAQWDLQFAYDLNGTTTVNELTLVGCEFDGEHFLVCEWGYEGANQPLVVFKLDRNGSVVDQWFPTWLTGGTTGLRDLAYDGEYFYGSNADSKIYCFDVDGNLITSWEVPAAVRSIAYDEDNDAFWINNWAEDLLLVDRSGDTLYTISTPPSMYGSAWEKEYSGTPTLWIFTGTSTGGPCQVEKYFDLYDGGLHMGIQHQVSDDFDPTGIAGGLFFTDEWSPGNGTLGGIIQISNNPVVNNTLFGYEIVKDINTPPEAPTITGPDNGDAGTAYLFTFNAVDPDGEDIRYIVDWGDGEIDTTGYSMSGVDISLLKSWNKAGTYTIKAKAQDIKGEIGPETTKSVTIPRDKTINNPFLNWLQNHPNILPILQRLLQNLGL
jgi:hypothetical protein